MLSTFLNSMFTNSTDARKCEIMLFLLPWKLQSDVSKHEVRCKVVDVLEAEIIKILHAKIINIGLGFFKLLKIK